MKKKLHILIATVSALVALGSGGAAPAGATVVDPWTVVDPCMVVPADATLWLGPNIPRVWASDSDYAHDSRPCKHFVVDIQVPSDSSGGWGFKPAFSIESWGLFAGGTCQYRQEWAYVYRKNGSEAGSFEYLGHVALYGEKLGATCQMTPIDGHDDPWSSSFEPPRVRVSTYRVLASAWYYNGWPWYSWDPQATKVQATHLRVL